jgi:PAS domain S-box-containing protein
VRLPDGQIDGVMNLSVDVTERVVARQQAAAADERRRLAFDAAGVGTWRIDLATNQNTRDAVLNRILGLPAVETTLPLDDSLSRVHPEDRPAVDAAIDGSLARGEDYEMEVRVVRPDGTLRWLRNVGRVVEDEHDRPITLTGTTVDITERKLADERARVAWDRLGAALAASQIGTYFWDMRTQRVEHDAGVKRLFGFSPDHGDSIDDYTARVHPDDRSGWLAGLEASARQGLDFHQEYRVVHDDAVHWLLDKGHVVRDAAGPAHMVGAVVDITEPKRLADVALAASRAKDEFLAMLGHELRNPLAPIVTALEIMKLRDAPGSKERSTIQRQVKHLVRLVDDLLDISRVTRGLIDLHREWLAVRDVVTKAGPLIEHKHHQLAVDLPAGLFVDGDAVRLAQVFANLLTNAARYTPEHGRIAVTASALGDRIQVRVRDNGIGISSDELESIFDLFVQGGERSVARSEGGLGIGLALVRNLLKLHDATVVATSDGPGTGSTFTVDLHAAVAPEPPRDAISPVALTATTRRVLVVDDNTDAADMLCAALQHLGHDVLIASDGLQALGLVDDFHPDVAVLDIGLPAMDGYELARRLRARGLDQCRLIAVTGYGQDEDRARSREAGFDVHLVKPVDLMRLASLIAPD